MSDLRVLASVLDLVGAAVTTPGTDLSRQATGLAYDSRLDDPRLRAVSTALRRLAAAQAVGLEVEFARIFLHHPQATAHPYESFYRSGALMDPGCIEELRGLFARAGIEVSRDGAPPVDHLGVELDFLALLLRGLADARNGGKEAGARALAALAGDLLDRHLWPFAGGFCARLRRLDPAPAFSAVGDVLVAALEAAADLVVAASGDAPPGAARSDRSDLL